MINRNIVIHVSTHKQRLDRTENIPQVKYFSLKYFLLK